MEKCTHDGQMTEYGKCFYPNMKGCEGKIITKEEWDNEYPEYKTIIDGQPYVLELDHKYGTVLVPVKFYID